KLRLSRNVTACTIFFSIFHPPVRSINQAIFLTADAQLGARLACLKLFRWRRLTDEPGWRHVRSSSFLLMPGFLLGPDRFGETWALQGPDGGKMCAAGILETRSFKRVLQRAEYFRAMMVFDIGGHRLSAETNGIGEWSPATFRQNHYAAM